jgi:predicted CoA-binding protein
MTAAFEETEEALAQLLGEATTIAVIGIKERPEEDAHRIPLYMQQAGYRIVPINPKLDHVLGEACHADLSSVTEPVSVVNLFRASDHIPGHVDEILALDPAPRAVWMQLGIHNGEAAQRLREAGIFVIQDRCIMVEHRRLLGGGA